MPCLSFSISTTELGCAPCCGDSVVLAGLLGSWIDPPQWSGHEGSTCFQFMKSISVSELGVQGTSCQLFISQKRKLQPETPHPAGPLWPPRRSSDHTPPQERECLYPPGFLDLLLAPTLPPPDLLSSSSCLVIGLDPASSQPWPGIH